MFLIIHNLPPRKIMYYKVFEGVEKCNPATERALQLTAEPLTLLMLLYKPKNALFNRNGLKKTLFSAMNTSKSLSQWQLRED